MPAVGGILSALRFAPAVLAAGREIVGAFTGREPPSSASVEDVADAIDRLPADQRAAAVGHVMAAKVRKQELDTSRFHALTAGDAERIRSTARPEIALRAMGVVTLFARVFAVLMTLAVVDWTVRAAFALLAWEVPDIPSPWSLIADAAPAAEIIWAPLVASMAACVRVITKYMGCRERDKARADEMEAGRPLESAKASIADAGGAVAGIIRAWKSR